MSKAELLAALGSFIESGDFQVVADEEARVAANSLLTDSYLFSGSWPDWSQTGNHRTHHQALSYLLALDFRRFFDQCLSGRSATVAFYANDGDALILRAPVASFSKCLDAFASTAHTSYFFGADGSWCLALRMSGRMDYGEAT